MARRKTRLQLSGNHRMPRHLWQTESRRGGLPMRTVKLFSLFFALVLAAGTAHSADTTIYPDPAQAKADIAAALKTAAATHKRVLLDFGGNWCGDCKVLDIYFHDQTNSPIVAANFVVVHVNVGHFDANQNIAGQYQIPLKKGVPAMAVL